jgi:hypothetical protein
MGLMPNGTPDDTTVRVVIESGPFKLKGDSLEKPLGR